MVKLTYEDNQVLITEIRAWSDDGSLTMCLTKSLVDTNFEYSNADWVVKLVAWYYHGYLSSADDAWDVGNATSIASSVWAKIVDNPSADDTAEVRAAAMTTWDSVKSKEYPIKAEGLFINLKRGQRAVNLRLDAEQQSGNGSLMRIAPLGAAFFKQPHIARLTARENSDSTHPSARCGDCCALYVTLVAAAMNGRHFSSPLRLMLTGV